MSPSRSTKVPRRSHVADPVLHPCPCCTTSTMPPLFRMCTRPSVHLPPPKGPKQPRLSSRHSGWVVTRLPANVADTADNVDLSETPAESLPSYCNHAQTTCPVNRLQAMQASGAKEQMFLPTHARHSFLIVCEIVIFFSRRLNRLYT